MTHEELVQRGLRWLKNTKRCGVVVGEVSCAGGEIPDCIGWKDQGQRSILIECKASRADFLADRHKWHRRNVRAGMGSERYYLCAPGVIRIDQIPDNWGLLYAMPKSIKVARPANPYPREAAAMAEAFLLYSLLRRVECVHGLQSVLELYSEGCRQAFADAAAQNEQTRLVQAKREKFLLETLGSMSEDLPTRT